MASTISPSDAAGAATELPVLRYSTISAPPRFARSTTATMRSGGSSCVSGTPPTEALETIGTIVASVCPPSTQALTSFTDAPVSSAMKVR